MVQRMQEYMTSDRGGSSRFVVRRVADELKLDDSVAADAIRDVSTGRQKMPGEDIRPGPKAMLETQLEDEAELGRPLQVAA